MLGEMFLLDAEGSVWFVLGKPNPTLCLKMFYLELVQRLRGSRQGRRCVLAVQFRLACVKA